MTVVSHTVRTYLLIMANSETNVELQGPKSSDIIYQVEDTPPWHITVLYVIQQVVWLAPSIAGFVIVLHPMVCGGDDYVFLAELTSSSLFMLGVGTLLQTAFGIRLPMAQGASWVFIPVIAVMMQTERFRCPDPLPANTTAMPEEPAWSSRIRVLSGSLMVGSVVQVVLGVTGLFGLLLPYIGPLTVAPTMGLLGLSLYPVVISTSQHHWGIAFLTTAIIVLFGVALRNVKVPLPSFSWQGGCSCSDGYYLFRMLAQIGAIVITWILCYILTVTDVFPDDPEVRGYMARTDAKRLALEYAQLFYFPLPGQWGPPLLDWGLVASMVVASLMGMMESTGDYYIVGKVCEKPPPPTHALNRGLALEGFINIICGSLNIGHGTASFSGPIAYLKVNGIASRSVFIHLGIVIIIVSLFGHVGGFLAMIPEPIIGGLNITSIGMLTMTGLATLQFADMNSSRNLVILAVSIMVGLAYPMWILDTPDPFDTGSQAFDELLAGVFSSSMFVGAVLGFTLDNIIPGSERERGIVAYRQHLQTGAAAGEGDSETAASVYDLPLISAERCGHVQCCTYMPFLPTHVERTWCTCACCKDRMADERQPDIDGVDDVDDLEYSFTKF